MWPATPQNKGFVTASKKHSDIVIAPNFDSVADLSKFLPFLNLYRDRGFVHLELVSFRKRHYNNVMAFLSSLNPKTINLKGNHAHYVEINYEGHEIIVFIKEPPHESYVIHLLATTNSSHEVLLRFLDKIPTSDANNGSSFDLSYFYISRKNGLSKRELYI